MFAWFQRACSIGINLLYKLSMNCRILPAFGSMLLLKGAKLREIEASQRSKYCKMIRYNKIFIMAITERLKRDGWS